MSPIGRIFVIINLVLSAGFLGFAANNLASAQKYRAQFDTVSAELAQTKTDMQASIDQLTVDRDAAVRMRAEMRNEKEDLDVKNTALQQQLSEANDELNQLKADMGNIGTSLSDLTSQVENMNSQVASANEDAKKAIEEKRDAQQAADEANQARVAAVDKANGLEADLAQAERDLTAEREKSMGLDTQLKEVLIATGYSPSGVGVPQIEGAVLQYDSEYKLVHINRGTNDQVKRGYKFDIFSGGVYKGQARVEVVNPGTCTAVVLSSVDGVQIMQGDRVSTQI